jgi:hypothetical protein
MSVGKVVVAIVASVFRRRHYGYQFQQDIEARKLCGGGFNIRYWNSIRKTSSGISLGCIFLYS